MYMGPQGPGWNLPVPGLQGARPRMGSRSGTPVHAVHGGPRHPQLRLCICLTFSALEPQARPRGPLCGPQLLQPRNSSVQCLDSPSCPTSCRNQCCCLAVSTPRQVAPPALSRHFLWDQRCCLPVPTLRVSGPRQPSPRVHMGRARSEVAENADVGKVCVWSCVSFKWACR